ncbi:MAG: glycoside hydrolase [Firmicutes bacterium]|nr:glycoside hydrolase [Bacillota bacterium]
MAKKVEISDHSLTSFTEDKTDERWIKTGFIIPAKYYVDQPFVVKTNDNNWLCVATTGDSHEGSSGQHIISLRSSDCGKTWTDFADVEPPDGVESSYAVLLKTEYGRIYCFYNHNTDNIRSVKADSPPYPDGYCKRVDSLGYFVFKYSDDNGKTWSSSRYNIPTREFKIDRTNADKGKIRYFWNVGKPFVHNKDAFVPLSKVGGFGKGFFTSSEGILLKSCNIMWEKDPKKITWETLPNGDIGLRAPSGGGRISEEHSYVVLSDGSFYANYRTIDGHPVETYSRDGGYTWEEPCYKKYADGRLFKNPRSANFVWKCQNGKYLYWFNNHSGRGYEDRNPAWISAGVEIDTPKGKAISWSQPEILLYADDPFIRMSYPDLIEEDGFYYITETQKNIARTHKFDGSWFNKMWDSLKGEYSLPNDGVKLANNSKMVYIKEFLIMDNTKHGYGAKKTRSGFTLEFVVGNIKSGDILFDTTTYIGGILVNVTADNAIRIKLGDGRSQNVWESDKGKQIADGTHICIVVDGGPGIISFVINGRFCDGGEKRQFGFGHFSLYDVNGADTVKLGKCVNRCVIYKRAIKNFEAFGLATGAKLPL